MMPLAMVAVLAQPSCPAFSPGDTYPLTVLKGCAAPVSGLLYGFQHEEVDAQVHAALMGANVAIAELDAVAREHADEWHPLIYVAGGAVLGVAAASAFFMGAR